MAGGTRGTISLDGPKGLVERGEIDTVVSAVCDMQGRLVDKRATASFFVQHLLAHGTHFCTYLLGTGTETLARSAGLGYRAAGAVAEADEVERATPVARGARGEGRPPLRRRGAAEPDHWEATGGRTGDL